jgi:glycosyltransferase involved in cell wall biosynthesis/ADP-heptose:LPS heptosyltransferase
MCTPILREIKRRNPKCEITFAARHMELFRGNPFIEKLAPLSSPSEAKAVGLGYNHLTPPKRPLATMMAECAGLSIRPSHLTPPDVNSVSDSFRKSVDSIGHPRIVVQPVAGNWTPNKQWPTERWNELIERLSQRCNVIEVGTKPLFDRESGKGNFWSFAGATSIDELAYVISQADAFTGPPSGGMHLANAFRIPSTILFGGYEGPEGYDYPWVNTFYNKVSCAPCWKTTPCPYELKCLRGIEVDDVYDSICAGIDWMAHPRSGQRSVESGQSDSRHVPGLVSVIIPAYNRTRMILEVVESVRAQTYPDIQLIVVDDGSTDGTADLIDGQDDIICIRQKNGGPSAARNRGMREARGEFLAFLDSDDLWEPEFLSESVAALRATKAGFVFSNWNIVHFDGETLSADAFADRLELMSLSSEREDDLFEFSADAVRDLFIATSLVTPSGIVLRHGYFNHQWDESSRIGEDRQFMIDGMFQGRFKAACLHKRLWTYRVHDSNLCTGNPDHISVSKGEIQFKETLLAKYKENIQGDLLRRLQHSLAASYFDLGYHLRRTGKCPQALAAFRASWQYQRSLRTLLWIVRFRFLKLAATENS